MMQALQYLQLFITLQTLNMAIKLGSTDINKRYLGNTEIKKVYLGVDLVFDNSTPIQQFYFQNLDPAYMDYSAEMNPSTYNVDPSATGSGWFMEYYLNTRKSPVGGFFGIAGRNVGGTNGRTMLYVQSEDLKWRYTPSLDLTITDFGTDYPFQDVTIRCEYEASDAVLYINGVEKGRVAHGNNFPTGDLVNSFYVGKMIETETVVDTCPYDLYSFNINNDVWGMNEGQGFNIYSEGGNIELIGGTDNPSGLTYWDSDVWTEYTPIPNNPNKDLYLMIGQSNMDGAAEVADASNQYKGKIPNAFVWWDFRWQPLEAGVTGSRIDKYGPTYALAKKLYDNDPTKLNFFVMEAQGGSGVWDQWGIGLSMYNEAVTQLNRAKQGFSFALKSIIFQQGEEDSRLQVHADAYEVDEAAMIAQMKIDTGFTYFVDATIGATSGMFPYKSTVNTAKQTNNTNNTSEALVDGDNLPLFDGVHYTAQGYETLAERYFQEVKNL